METFNMLLAALAVLGGLILLVLSADRFVFGASGLALNLGVSPLMIGLTIVAFGTSAPEIFVSAAAALQNNPNLAIGNAIGSNIANVGLVLGLTALIVPVAVHRGVIEKQFPIMFAVMAISVVVFLNDYLSRFEAIVLTLVLLIFIVVTVLNEKKQIPVIEERDIKLNAPRPAVSVFWLITGLTLLVVSSKILVWGAVEIATELGVSDLVIGLTIIAVGTSLPEVATSIASAMKGSPDLAIGNVVGSNIFNLLAVIGTVGLITPTSIYPDVMNRDVIVMIVISVLMVVMITPWRSMNILNRSSGFILLACYLCYLTYVCIQTIKT